ncbi:S-adenosyl-L-methionine-dependent methyltransferase [Zopfochytrium polystomum]|nr:S-adenosyl-L-methionine-dependent methyltransferase [Zopfochytrium polystomum]
MADAAAAGARETAIVAHVIANSTKGDPDSVIAAFDDYGRRIGWFMAVGDEKGAIIDSLIGRFKPASIVEIGGYIGYSAVRFMRLLPPGGKLVTFEYNPQFARLARQVVEHSGLADRWVLIEGGFSSVWSRMRSDAGLHTADMFFIDHWKTMYLADFQLIENEALTHTGSIVVADNVITPGAPDYLSYVNAGGKDGRTVTHHELFHSHLEYSNEPDAVSLSIMA